MSRHRETVPEPGARATAPAPPDPASQRPSAESSAPRAPDGSLAAPPPEAAPEAPRATEPLPTAEELSALRAQAALAEERWDRLLRLQAEFDNYRKRVERDRDELRRRATEELMRELLPVLDHFELGLTAPAPSVEGAALMAGMRLIQRQLCQVLEQAGLRRLDATGQQFDPNFHEAVGCVPTRDAREGTVVEQVRNGYCLHDRLLRPATVRVAVALEEGVAAAPPRQAEDAEA